FGTHERLANSLISGKSQRPPPKNGYGHAQSLDSCLQGGPGRLHAWNSSILGVYLYILPNDQVPDYPRRPLSVGGLLLGYVESQKEGSLGRVGSLPASGAGSETTRTIETIPRECLPWSEGVLTQPPVWIKNSCVLFESPRSVR